jgi:AAA ATPase domain
VLTLSVRHFGPLEDATVDLKPLTLFVGPNNTGKSYLATLIYALVNALRLSLDHADDAASPPGLVEAWLARGGGTLQTAPADVQDSFDTRLGAEAWQYGAVLGGELRRCFAAKLGEIVGVLGASDFRLEIRSSNALLAFARGRNDEELTLERCQWEWSARLSQEAVRARAVERRGLPLATTLIAPFLAPLNRGVHFLPAGRSALLQAYRPLVTALVSREARLAGTIRDFMVALVNLTRAPSFLRPQTLDEVASFIERRICAGQVDFEEGLGRVEAPEIVYGPDQLPIHRVSSTIAETAPIVLFLRHVVGEHDAVVVEEPEAHLHPDNQRLLAQALVKLVRRGLQVIVTTHSDYFVEQVSNFVRLGSLPDLRARLGYDADDYLDAGEVGAYLFRSPTPAGPSRVEALPVTSDEGIPGDVFARVTEALYDETSTLVQAAADGRP